MRRATLHWFKPFDKMLEWNFPFAKWFVGGKINAAYNCLDRHLDSSAPQQGRAHLGGRARRLARADLPDARRRSWALRQRAQEPRRQGGRPRRDLHAAGAGGGDRDARVRADRRDSFGGVRRLLGRGAGRSNQRRRGEGLSSPRTADGVAGRSSSSSSNVDEALKKRRLDPESARAQARRQQGRDAQGARRLVGRAGSRAKPEVRRPRSSTAEHPLFTLYTSAAPPASPRASCIRPADI